MISKKLVISTVTAIALMAGSFASAGTAICYKNKGKNSHRYVLGYTFLKNGAAKVTVKKRQDWRGNKYVTTKTQYNPGIYTINHDVKGALCGYIGYPYHN